MAFLDKLGDMAKNIGDKAGDAVETTKLNSKINAEQKTIDGIYKKIGEYYYGKHQSGESLPEEAAAFCAEIDGHNAVIDEAKKEIERVKSENKFGAAPAAGLNCPACGKKNDPNMKFCQECGCKLEPAPVAEGISCPACGIVNTSEKKFCQDCGAKLEAPAKRICSCGAEVAPDKKFCGECGAKFE